MKTKKMKLSLFEQEMKRKSFRKAFQREKKILSLERQIAQALGEEGWTYEEFAKRIGTARSHVSRDLKGGLSHSTIHRIERIAKSLHMRYVPLLIPEEKADKVVSQIMQLVR